MEELFKLPEGAEPVHAMVLYEDYLLVSDGKSIYKFHVPPKTIWLKARDLFIKGKDWLLE